MFRTRSIIGLALIMELLLTSSSAAYARIIFTDDVFENDSETYEIGSDDDAAATTLTLEFGGTNAESLTWNTSIFTLSDDLTVQGNLIATDITANGTLDANGPVTLGDNGDTITIDSSSWDISSGGLASGFTGITSTGTINFGGASDITIPHTNSTSFTIDNDESGNPDQDIDIIAEQGTENNGILRYDDGNNRWEFSNDGATFLPIATDGDLATAQMRETDGDIVSTPGFADIDFNTVDIESDSSVIDADASTDDFTVQEDGFYLITYDFSDTNDVTNSISAQVLLNGSTVINGSASSSGTHTAITGGSDFGQAFIAQLSTSDSVTLQMSSPVGSNNVTAGGVFTITKLDGVRGDPGPGTDNNTFTIDQDDTGGDVTLRFGTANNETLTWNDTNSEFEVSAPFQSLCGHSMVFWAEEAGTLSTATSGGLQFSWGNGNVAAHGAVQACSGQVVALTMNCDVNSTAGDTVQVALNGVAQGSGCEVSSPGTANFKTSDTTCSVAFSADDAIAPITTADAGNGNGCTVAMYVRYD